MQERLHLNFAQRWEQKLARPQVETKRSKTVQISMAGVIGILVLSAPWIYEYTLNTRIQEVESKISSMPEIDVQVLKMDALNHQIENQMKVIDLINKNTKDPGSILNKVRVFLPAGTVVTKFVYNADNSLSISLTVPGPVDVARLWSNLNDSEMFQSFDIQTVSLQDKAQLLNLNLKMK